MPPVRPLVPLANSRPRSVSIHSECAERKVWLQVCTFAGRSGLRMSMMSRPWLRLGRDVDVLAERPDLAPRAGRARHEADVARGARVRHLHDGRADRGPGQREAPAVAVRVAPVARAAWRPRPPVSDVAGRARAQQRHVDGAGPLGGVARSRSASAVESLPQPAGHAAQRQARPEDSDAGVASSGQRRGAAARVSRGAAAGHRRPSAAASDSGSSGLGTRPRTGRVGSPSSSAPASATSGTASVAGVLAQPLGHLAAPQLGQHAVEHHRGRHQAQRGLHRLHAVRDLVGGEAVLLGHAAHLAARPLVARRHQHQRRPRLRRRRRRAARVNEKADPCAGHALDRQRARRARARCGRRCRGPARSPRCRRCAGRARARTAGTGGPGPGRAMPMPRSRTLTRGRARPAARDRHAARSPPAGRVLDRVREQVLEHLRHAVAVGPARQRVLGQLERRAGGARRAGKRSTTSRTTAARSTSPNSNGKWPVSSRVVLSVLSTRLAMCVAAWMIARACSMRSAARRVRPPLQQLRVAQHARQRRPEVVGHDVHQLALHAVQLDQLARWCAPAPGTARRCAA